MGKKRMLLAAGLSVVMAFNLMSVNVSAQTTNVPSDTVEGTEVAVQGEQKEQKGQISEKEKETVLKEAEKSAVGGASPARTETDRKAENRDVVRASDGQSLADWEYEETADTIVLSKYKGTAGNVVVPSEFTEKPGCKVKLKNEFVFGEAGSKGNNVLFSRITSIKIGTDPDNKVGIVSDSMGYMFAGAAKATPSSLVTADLSCFDTSNVTNMERLFNYGSNLKSVDFTGFDTGNVTNMTAMFQYCTVLEDLDLSSFDTGNVTAMVGMFINCHMLKTVDVSSFDTSNVTDMKSMFNGCKALQNLDLTNFDIRKVTSMMTMFYNCTSLQTVDMSGLKADSLLTMEGCFANCTNLKEINLSGFTASNIENMYGSFMDCEKLEKLDLSGFTTDNVTTMKTLFQKCYVLKSINFGDNFNTGSVTDMSFMFNQCNSLEELDIVGSFDTGNVTNMSTMFQGCDKLINLDVSNFDTSKTTDMSFMFNNMECLESLDISSFDTSKVTTMEQMIQGLPKLKTMNLGNMVIPAGIDTTSLFKRTFGEEAIAFAADDNVRSRLNTEIGSKKPYEAKIVYHANGGDFGTAVTEQEWTIKGDKVIYNNEEEFKAVYEKRGEEILAKYTPAKDGQLFNGWYLDEECNNPLSSDETVDFTNAENKTLNLYASWKAAPLQVEGGTPGVDWTYRDGVLTFVNNGDYKVTGDVTAADKDRIVVPDNFAGTLTIENLNIAHGSSKNTEPCIEVSGSADLTLMVEGTNELRVNDGDAAAIQFEKAAGGRLVIDSKDADSVLKAYSKTGIAIGSASDKNPTEITVNGGNISAEKIGGNAPGSKVILTGGNINASIQGDAVISGGYISGDISGKVINPQGEELVKVEIHLESDDIKEVLIDGVDQKINKISDTDTISIYVTKGRHEITVVGNDGKTFEYIADVKADGSMEALLNNAWVSELQLDSDVISYGESLSGKTEALFGNDKVYYMYSDEEKGTYEKEMPDTVGIYWVKAVIDKTDRYTGLESAPVKFEIKKAVPTPEEITGLTIVKGKTLDTLKLPEGFAWFDGTQTADELGTHEFKAIYTPKDTVNYETVEVMIEVEVVSEAATGNTSPSDTDDKPKPDSGTETSDTANPWLWASLLVGSAGALTILAGKRRKSSKEN